MKFVARGERRSRFSALNPRLLRLLLLHILALLARPIARRAPGPIARILYIKPDHLGDLLLATPALAALRRRFPNAQITALVGPWSQMALQRNPDVDRLLVCPFPGFTRAQQGQGPEMKRARSGLALSSFVFRLSSLAKPYLLLLRYGLLLRAGRYELAIVGRDDHWWGAALALLAGVPARVGFAVPECRPFLTTTLRWDPADHVTAQGLALVAASQSDNSSQFSTFNSQFSARFDPTSEDLGWAQGWLKSQGLAGSAPLVIIHPGTGGPAKLWFAERWVEVVDALQTAGASVVITGGPGEEALVAAIADRAAVRPPALAGRTTVGQLAALLRAATLVLGVDSGPLHLAAAQDTPTLHLYGPGDAGRFGPWGDPRRHIVIRAALWCSPCGVFEACPRGLERPECMERIAVADVVHQAQQLMTAPQSRSSAREPGA